MNPTETGAAYRLYRSAKVGLNFVLDRVIERCDAGVVEAHRLPWANARHAAKKMSQCVGDLSWYLRDFPRLPAHTLVGPHWTIVFVGSEAGLREICHLLFEGRALQGDAGRVEAWDLARQARTWLENGIDLVVCEQSRLCANRLAAPIAFTIPVWVNQVLRIPQRLESLLSGKRYATERHRLNKASRLGYSYRFSRTVTDFSHYHHHMHLPYVTSRHGPLALLSSYEERRRRYLDGGGVVLVTRHGKPVAGVLCYLADNTCFDIERGVLQADPELFRHGIETMMTWYALNWAHDQHVEFYDMGATRAWRSNGAFRAKRRWGPRVVRRRGICGSWRFLARDLTPSLHDRLNELGLVTEIDGGFYSIVIGRDDRSPDDAEIRNEFVTARQSGLSGLAIISNGATRELKDLAEL